MGKNWTQVLQDRRAGLVPGFRPEIDPEEHTRAELVTMLGEGVEVDAKATKDDIATVLNGG